MTYMHATVGYMLMLLDSRPDDWVRECFTREDGTHPTREEAREWLAGYPHGALIPCGRADCNLSEQHAKF